MPAPGAHPGDRDLARLRRDAHAGGRARRTDARVGPRRPTSSRWQVHRRRRPARRLRHDGRGRRRAAATAAAATTTSRWSRPAARCSATRSRWRRPGRRCRTCSPTMRTRTASGSGPARRRPRRSRRAGGAALDRAPVLAAQRPDVRAGRCLATLPRPPPLRRTASPADARLSRQSRRLGGHRWRRPDLPVPATTEDVDLYLAGVA